VGATERSSWPCPTPTPSRPPWLRPGTPLDLFQRIAIAPASITAVVYRPHGPSVLTVNSVDGDLAWLGGKP
jgi:hypothetical protein